MTLLSPAYQGCYKDRKPHRDMKKHFSKFEMTPEWCLHTCKKEGYRFAGVQYSYLCFCGNKFGKYGRVPDSECSSRCYGDKNRFCGSFWHNSIYSVGMLTSDLKVLNSTIYAFSSLCSLITRELFGGCVVKCIEHCMVVDQQLSE